MVAWSFSVLNSFDTCAYRHYKVTVKKEFREAESDEMRWGNRVHKAFENRLRDGTPMPADLHRMEPYAARMEASAKGGMLEAERKIALNDRFEPVAYFAKDVWVRVVIDVLIDKRGHAFVGDWKTGARKPDSAQLRLSVAAVFHALPYIEVINNAFIWLKEDKIDAQTFHRADTPAIWQEFMPRVQRLENAFVENKWPKKPSGLCRKHCPVRDCEFHGGS